MIKQSSFTNTQMAPDNLNSNNGFKFNKTIYDSGILIKVKSPDREDYEQQLNIKIVLHAQSTSTQQ